MAEITLFKSQDEIVAEMLAQLQGAVPDVYLGDDGILRIIFEIEAGQFENAFLANDLVFHDMFAATASYQGLLLHGNEVGLPIKVGTNALGTVTFEGQGGTYVPIGAEVGYDPGNGQELLYFQTTLDGTIPNPGSPTAVTAAVSATAGVLTGLYEYKVTFVTAGGETLTSPISAGVNPSAKQVNLSAIPVGGAGTTARKIYRDKNGAGTYRLVTTLADNTTTSYADNIADATVAANPLAPTVNTANRITLTAQAEAPGVDSNVLVNTITELVDAPATLTGVVASSAFTGGSDPEDTEDYRGRLLEYKRNPQTGSPSDLETWAESIVGVEDASVFINDNLGVSTPGHTTVRIVGPGGAAPSVPVQNAVYDYLISKDLANVTIHVGTFTSDPLNVTVDVTTSGTYTLADVTPSVQQAITDYINGLSVGETFYLSGVIAAVKPLLGVADVTISVPSANQTRTSTQRFSPGTITVT